MILPRYAFYEFFAGGGMARAGLGRSWECLFANDFDPKKAAAYRTNWGDDDLCVADVRDLTPSRLPGRADMAWASFPCQDLSLAGAGSGLQGERSGSFRPFWDLIRGLAMEGRAPSVVVLENVCGALSSHRGEDFAAICSALKEGGYRFGAVVMDASLFLPQSRPRLFIVAVHEGLSVAGSMIGDEPRLTWHPAPLLRAWERLGLSLQGSWLWWNIPAPEERRLSLGDFLEEVPTGVTWHSSEQTEKILGLMSDGHLEKVEEAKRSGRRAVGALYRRTRTDRDGRKVQRAEVRFDGVAGCLRTPAGGSSRQTILVVEGEQVRSRLLSAREAARLMGLPDAYLLPERYNDAYHIAGDGVAVPVVRHLAEHLIEPVLNASLEAS